jgi:hypothetical protein
LLLFCTIAVLLPWVTCLLIEQQSQQESPGPSEREKATAIKGQRLFLREGGKQKKKGRCSYASQRGQTKTLAATA